MPRKSGYTPEIGERICELLAGGMSLLAMFRLEDMKPEATMRRWARDPKNSDQEFVANYARAREMGIDHLFDRMVDIEDRLEVEDIAADVARALLDSIKWRLSKMLPGVYGDRQHIEHSGTVKVETVKDHAPEWMQDRLTKPAAEPDEAETVH